MSGNTEGAFMVFAAMLEAANVPVGPPAAVGWRYPTGRFGREKSPLVMVHYPGGWAMASDPTGKVRAVLTSQGKMFERPERDAVCRDRNGRIRDFPARPVPAVRTDDTSACCLSEERMLVAVQRLIRRHGRR